MERQKRVIYLFYLLIAFCSIGLSVGILLISLGKSEAFRRFMMSYSIFYLAAGIGFLVLAFCVKKLPMIGVFFATHVFLIYIILVLYPIFYDKLPELAVYPVLLLTSPILWLEYKYISDKV